MKQPDDIRNVQAFVDGELDLGSQLVMEQRLQDDAALRAQVDEVRLLRNTIRDSADYHTAPAALRDRVAGVGAMPPSPVRERHLPAAASIFQRWFGWRPMAASLSFAALLAVAANVLWLQTSQDDRLMDEVLASHVRSTLGQHLVDVASSDHHTVKPWLSSRLDFSPPVSELKLAGSTFLGGRLDYLNGRPVAALVYRQGAHVVDSFVWPRPSVDSQPVFKADRGFQTAHWSRNGMAHWVISDVNAQEFQAVVVAIEASDNSP